jgi:hypothetical protein
MLDPELLANLAAHPERNAPDVNRALAEEGGARVLRSLARSPATQTEALEVVAGRLERNAAALEEEMADPEDDDDERAGDDVPFVLELERLLVAHDKASDAVRDALLARHPDDAYFVLAAAAHPRATTAAVERAARWPCRYPVLDRPWIALVPPHALAPLLAEAWAQDDDVLLRETVARLGGDAALLATLARDPARQVRRALASNPRAAAIRPELARDPAPEVRARALAPLDEGGLRTIESARFDAALRAMEHGGVLAPDVTAALSSGDTLLDEEGALLAARALPRQNVAKLVRELCLRPEPPPAAAGLAAGLALRAPGEDGGAEGLRDLVAEAVKALMQASAHFGTLTGKARLAAWLSEGLASSGAVDRAALVDELASGAVGGETPVLLRCAASAPDLARELLDRARHAAHVPAPLLELAWRTPAVDADALVGMARRLAPPKQRGADLPDDELDLDPTLRDLDLLERVVLAVGKQVTLTPRSALPVVALDSRRVRYVLTAMAHWRGRLSGTMLARVLRQQAGALSAGRSESRGRAAEVREWTERILSDTEVAVAIAVGHFTSAALVDRVEAGRHRIADGDTLASGAEARAVLEGPKSIAPLVAWATRYRATDPAALALWLLLEKYDRERQAGTIASAVDGFAVRQNAVSEVVSEALATLERRRPGRLDAVVPQTPRGKATHASAMARAYRALGGLR